MEYNILIDKIKRNLTVHGIFGNQNLNIDLTDIRIITKSQTRFKESTLYLTTTNQLPDISINDNFIVFSYGEPIDFSIYSQASFNIIYFGNNISQAELFNIIIENMKENPLIFKKLHILMNALYNGKGLQYLVDTASELFANPIYVVDLQYKYLAISSGVFPNNTFYKEQTEAHYISEEGTSYIRKNNIDQKVRESILPLYYFNEIAGHGVLTSVIHIEGIEVGHIMIQESEHKFREEDKELLYHFTRLVSIELQKNSVFTDNKGIMYSYFLADLLKNTSPNIDRIKKRLKSLDFNLTSNLYIMVIPADSYRNSTTRLEVILQNIKYILVGSLYVIYENSIVFLIPKEKYQEFSEQELERLTNFLESSQLKAGISNFFETLEETPRFYKQALDALYFGSHLGHQSSIYYYKDYYIYQLLYALEKEDKEIRYLIHPGIMKLYLYDQENNTNFIDTLREYLVSPGQPSLVAKNLFIHKNTLLYRLSKIKEITSCDLTTGEDYMYFNLSLRIMAYLHMI